MKMTNEKNDDLALEALFESARTEAPDLAPDFLARLETDAANVMAEQDVTPVAAPSNGSFWARVGAALFPISGLAAATLAGVWIGFQTPTSDFAAGFSLGDSTDFDVSAFLPAVALSGFAELEADG